MSPKTIFRIIITIIIINTILLSHLKPTSALEFVFNTNFKSSSLLTYGHARIQESSTLSLTNDTTFSIGRAFYPFKIIPTKPNSSFFTSFIFSISPIKNLLPGHGFALVFFPSLGIDGASSAQHLGLFNFTNDGNSSNHVLGVEFDTFRNQEFNDVNDNHVGVDVNSLTSVAQKGAGFWSEEEEEFEELKLNNGVNYQVWIDYAGSRINVTMAIAGAKRPNRPLISEFLNLSGVLLDEMYVGFTGATGQLVQSHRILSWSFSNANASIGDALVTRNLPSFVPPPEKSVVRSKWFVVGITVAVFVLILGFGSVIGYVVLLSLRKRRVEMNKGEKEGEKEDWELLYWPHRIKYQEIYAATDGFKEDNVVGVGGNGKVFKGLLDGAEVAVKMTSLKNKHGMKEFLAEVSSLGRLKHRNVVGIRGWCKSNKGTLILVYDYMENGSLDKRVFDCDENCMLGWEERVKALKDVARGILYLHEGWEAKVLHRDIKASNVLLDKDMNARLGDFGLAQMHWQGQSASTTRVVGTLGYMAPEVVRTGRASTQTDVFGFGVLVLEVVCGRRPIEEGKLGLVESVWRLMERGEVIDALDYRLKAKRDGYSNEEVEKFLHLGLVCAYPDPRDRPTMRQVVKLLEGGGESSEQEGEGMEVVHLLDGMRINGEWSRYRQNFAAKRHPTADEILSSISSLGISDLSEGRGRMFVSGFG